MPWASKKQVRWGHSKTGVKALGGKAKVAEWDAATKKGSLPAKAKKPGGMKLSNLMRAPKV
jgi:hypothetical protein